MFTLHSRLATPICRLIASASCTVLFCGAASAQVVTKITFTPTSVVGGTSAKGTVTISKKAGVDGVTVTFTSSSSAVSLPQIVSIPKGSTSAAFTVATLPVGTNTSVQISGKPSNQPVSGVLKITAPTLKALTLSASSVAAGAGFTGTVKVSSPAPAGGLPIKLSADKPNVGVPQSFSIPSGALTATFDGSTTGGGNKITAKVTATLGTSSIGVPITVVPPTLKSLTFNPSSVVGGNSSTGTLTISGPAPSGGLSVVIVADSSNPVVPTNLLVPAGSSSVTFIVTTRPVTVKTPVTLTAKLGTASVKGTLTIVVGAASKFAGSYTGVYYTPTSDLGTLTISISATGYLTGSSTDDLASGPTTVSGTVSSEGSAIVTTTSGGVSKSHQGTFSFNAAGYLVGTFFGSDQTQTIITLAPSGKLLPFSGKYTGTFSSAGGDSGTVSITISATGALTGTANPSKGGLTTLQGTVSTLGVVVINVTSNGQTEKNTGGAAFDASGKVIVIVKNPAGDSVTTVTLTKS